MAIARPVINLWVEQVAGGEDMSERGRALAARVLAGRLGRAVTLEPGRHGRPVASGAQGVLFNVSHSGRLLALGLADGHPVEALGLDLEEWRAPPRPGAFAQRILAPTELSALANAPPEALTVAWTAKEAALKAVGIGLHGDPRDWVFDWASPADPRLVAAPAIAGDAERWAFARLDLEAPVRAVVFVAARLASRGKIRIVDRSRATALNLELSKREYC